jgi:hypothetical protein
VKNRFNIALAAANSPLLAYDRLTSRILQVMVYKSNYVCYFNNIYSQLEDLQLNFVGKLKLH